MSVLSASDWNDFLQKIGSDFYDLVHGVDGNETTVIDYPCTFQYYGVGSAQIYRSGSTNYGFPVFGWVTFDYDNTICFQSDKFTTNSNYVSSGSYYTPIDVNLTYTCPRSYFVGDHHAFAVASVGGYDRIGLFDYQNNFKSSIFSINMDYVYQDSNNRINSGSFSINEVALSVTNNHTSYTENNGYYTFSNPNLYPICNLNPYGRSYTLPHIIDTYPVIINSNEFDSSLTVNSIKNIYNTDNSVQNYTYNIDENNYIDVNYTTDSNGVPTGYIDINPTGQISFDDLFDMFNTILAPIVGIDIPDWNDYAPPAVTGDINVNIDLPDVTGEYPAETITPIDSDVYNIMSIDSMPQLPSLTGIDNGESAAALGVSFTFLDGCGLLMPFVTVAIIRLLISKFRGDS